MSLEYYTTDEVADILRVKKETVREWCREGKMTAIKRGRSYLIAKETLIKYLEAKHG